MKKFRITGQNNYNIQWRYFFDEDNHLYVGICDSLVLTAQEKTLEELMDSAQEVLKLHFEDLNE